MRNDKSRVMVPPVVEQLFPQRHFQPYVALDQVNQMVGDVLARRRASPPNLERLQSLLSDVGKRLVSAAQGGLPVHRWYRRIAVSVRLCHQAQTCLSDYAGTDAMTAAEAASIRAGLDVVIARLNDALACLELPDDERALLPLTFPRPSDLH